MCSQHEYIKIFPCVHELWKWDVQGAVGLDWLVTTHAIALCQRPYCTRLSVHQSSKLCQTHAEAVREVTARKTSEESLDKTSA